MASQCAQGGADRIVGRFDSDIDNVAHLCTESFAEQVLDSASTWSQSQSHHRRPYILAVLILAVPFEIREQNG